MSLSKVEPTKSEVDEETNVDNSKRLFQYIIESGRKLEVASSKCREVQDLFSSEFLAKRQRYKEMCEKLICESIKVHGPIVREKLWRYAYYEPYNRARQLKRPTIYKGLRKFTMDEDKPWTPYQLAFIQNHLLTGIGQFNILLWKIQEVNEFQTTPVNFRSNGIDTTVCGPVTCFDFTMKEENPPPKWLLELIHICLINIGDLYRYLTDIYSKIESGDEEKEHYFNGAVEYYTKAFLVYPEAGLSHNQLGNLFVNVKGGIHAVYYLLYSIVSANSYEGAFPNLRQLLDRKIVRFVTQPASVEPTPMDLFNFSFFSVVFHFLCEDSRLKNFEKSCQDALTNFNERLVSCDPDCDEKFLFHVSLISIMTVWRLQASNSPNVSPAVAFALTIFLQLTAHLGVILEQHSHLAKEISSTPSPIKALEEGISDIKFDTQDETHELNIQAISEEIPVLKKKKRKKNVLQGRRRRKRVKSPCEDGRPFSMIPSQSDDESDYYDEGVEDTDGSDESSDDEGSDEDYSDSEQESSIDSAENEQLNENDRAFDSGSSNGQSDVSGGSQKTTEADSIKLTQECPSEFETSSTPGPDDAQNQKGKFVIEKEDLLKCRNQIEPLLIAIAPFMKWLQLSPMVKDAFAANCERVFLEKLCASFNLLGSFNWTQLFENLTNKEELARDWEDLGKPENVKKFGVELPEDRSLVGLPNFKEYFTSLKLNANLTKVDMFLTRIGRFLDFGYWMTETECFSVVYNPEEKFLVPPANTLQRYLQDAKLRRLNKGLAPSGVIEKLTKAYHNKEVPRGRIRRGRGREGGKDIDRKRRRHIRKDVDDPINLKQITYVVVDLAAMLQQFVAVKRMACHPQFIMAVPQSIRRILDTMKETEEEGSSEARIAGRWLEQAFYKSHPGLRALKEGDKIPLEVQYPEEDDNDTREYFELFEHCNFLLKTEVRQGKKTEYFGDVRDKYSVLFLSGDEDFLKKPDRSFCPIQIARAVGFWVDLASLYPTSGKRGRNKKSFKSNG